ncbi:AAA family ATPase [Candidatus Saccharibacteria bacterium]|nr:AAA family ATPase [Candidatus Saccharibacteria bacterium]MBI3338310.1 AAA family ATPase [Candidatus Saccharibacteria bacterium]
MIIQIDGISGTGKTTAAEELIKRGYAALDADEAFGYYGNPETGEPTYEQTQHNWIWDLNKVKSLAKSSEDTTIFVCGGAMNQDRVRGVFDKRFTLVVDDDTMRHRLMTRTNNDFGKHPDDLARQLEWNKGATEYATSIGAIVIDATKPIEQVVDNILAESGIK